MTTTRTTCDGCGKDLSASPRGHFLISVRNEWVPAAGPELQPYGNRHPHREIMTDLHFCGLRCLIPWVRTP